MDDDATLPTEAGLASDSTMHHDPDKPVSSTPSAGPVIRGGTRPVPQRLGRYVVMRPLGRGGMGAVYEAEDPELGRRVALKVLREDRSSPALAEALKREAQALARLVHPNVVTVFDVGEDGGQVFLVMQLVDGESIDRWLHARHAKPRAIVAAFLQAGAGLVAAHSAGLVHCDFKPSNVLVDADGVVRVGDFGLARLELPDDPGSSTISGTPAYMAPEQFKGVATAASDQFAFCVALWEMLAGERPFATVTVEGQGERRAFPAGRAPSYIVRALERGIAEEPAARFASMAELLAALAPPRWPRRAALVGAFVVVAGGTAAGVIAARRDPTAPPPPPPPLGVPDLAAAHDLTHYDRTACAYSPTVLADRIVFDRTLGDDVDLYSITRDGKGEPKQLTRASTWEWRSHPGRTPHEVVHLITDTANQTLSQLALLDVDTLVDTPVAPITAHDVISVGNAIVYITVSRHEVHRLESGRDVTIATAPGGALFNTLSPSPDGNQFAVTTVREAAVEQLCFTDVAGTKLDCHDDGPIDRPAFGADARAIYFPGHDGIHRRELATGKVDLIAPDAYGTGGLAIAPEGRALVYSSCAGRTDIVDVSASPAAVLVHEATATFPAAGPLHALAWLRNVRGTRVLEVRRPDGSESQLTDVGIGAVRFPAFSPDGTHLAYVAPSPHPGIHVTSTVPGQLPEQVTSDASDERPVWLGNDTLAFMRVDERSVRHVYTVSVDGGEAKPLGTSSRALYGSRHGELLVIGTRALYWMDAKGHERPGPISPDVPLMDASISPDGHWVAYQTGRFGGDFWRVQLDPPGKLEHVASLQAGVVATQGIAITDEGHILAAPAVWAGDLVEIPAKPGTRY